MVSRREYSSVGIIWLSPGKCAQSVPPHTDTGTHHSVHEHTSHGLSRQEGGAGATAHDISRLAARAFLREREGGRGTPKCEGVLSVRGDLLFPFQWRMLAPSSVSRLMSPFQPRPEGGGERKKREGRRVEQKHHGGYTKCVPCRLLTSEERGRRRRDRQELNYIPLIFH